MTDLETRFTTQLQVLQNILRELGSKELGDDPSWIENYVYRLREATEELHLLATSHSDNNPTHRSYP